MTPILHLSLLGPLEIRRDPPSAGRDEADQQGLPIQASALLVYLAASQGEQSRAALAQLLWGDEAQEMGMRQLAHTLETLVTHFPDQLVVTDAAVDLRNGASLYVDLHEFAEKTASLADPMGWPDPAALQDAVALYRDDFWADMPAAELADAPHFLEWVVAQRAHWRQQVVRALSALLDAASAQRDHTLVIQRAQQLLALDPADESAHRYIMLAQARRGRTDLALAQYDKCAESVTQHQARDPDAETEALYARIEQVHTERVPSLPPETDAFVGRAAELEQLRNLLLNDECRLITLTGLGGIGKTRLAVEAARAVNQNDDRAFLQGVIFVPLAGIQSAEALPLAISNTLGMVMAANVDVAMQLRNHLRNREMVLLLDNVEHLLDAARDLIAQILQECPHATILATSRVPLQLEAEWRFDVAGLICTPPAPDAPDPCPSSQLFAQAAQRVQPTFALGPDNRMEVYRLGKLLSGIPLALELAAAWARTMSCAEILANVQSGLDLLTDQQQRVVPRQRSMRVIFDYTWGILDRDERKLLQTLSVFRAPFNETAVTRVTELDTALLARLVEHRLLQLDFVAGDMRYAMHELIRQYGAEKLVEAPDADDIREKHCCYYLSLVAQHQDALFGGTPHAAIGALRREVQNIRAAWQWAVNHLERAAVQSALSSAVEAYATFYENVGWVQEGERSLAAGVAACDALEDQSTDGLQDLLCQLLIKQARFAELRSENETVETLTARAIALAKATGNRLRYADALRVWGRTLGEMAEFASAIALLEEAVQIYRALDRRRELAITLNALGGIYLFDQNIEFAERYTQEALQLHTELENQRGAAFSTSQMGNIHYYREDFEGALAHLRRALAQFENVHYSLGVVRTANNVGYVYWRMGNHDEALPYLERSLQLAQRLGIRQEEGNVHESLGAVYLALGAYSKAQRSFEHALRLAEETGWKLGTGWIHGSLGLLHLELDAYQEARTHFQKALELMQQLENEREIGICLGRLGSVHRHLGETDQALAQYDAAIQMVLGAGGKHEAADFMVEKAQLLLGAGEWAQAEQEARAAIALATDIEHRAALHHARLLLARTVAAQGNVARARQQLHGQLVDANSTVERAAIHYTLWRVDGDLQYAQNAHTFYTELYAHTPLRIYHRRIQELSQGIVQE